MAKKIRRLPLLNQRPYPSQCSAYADMRELDAMAQAIEALRREAEAHPFDPQSSDVWKVIEKSNTDLLIPIVRALANQASKAIFESLLHWDAHLCTYAEVLPHAKKQFQAWFDEAFFLYLQSVAEKTDRETLRLLACELEEAVEEQGIIPVCLTWFHTEAYQAQLTQALKEQALPYMLDIIEQFPLPSFSDHSRPGKLAAPGQKRLMAPQLEELEEAFDRQKKKTCEDLSTILVTDELSLVYVNSIFQALDESLEIERNIMLSYHVQD